MNETSASLARIGFRRRVRLRLIVLGVLLALVGVGLAARQIVYVTWPTADAVVLQGHITEQMSSQDANGHPLYRPELQFRYAAGGSQPQTATGTASYWSNDRSEAEQAVARLPVGSHVTVHVDPAHPDVVRYDVDLASFTIPALCLGGAAIAVLAAFVLGRVWRSSPARG
jgi:hypothetical protein